MFHKTNVGSGFWNGLSMTSVFLNSWLRSCLDQWYRWRESQEFTKIITFWGRYVLTTTCIAIYGTVAETLHRKPKMLVSRWRKNPEITEVSRTDPQGTVFIRLKFHPNPSRSWQDIFSLAPKWWTNGDNAFPYCLPLAKREEKIKKKEREDSGQVDYRRKTEWKRQ